MPGNQQIEKITPQNLDAEMAVLGSMLLDEEAIATAVEKLDRNFFYKDSHQKIFQVISDLYSANKAVDLITLTDALKREGIIDDVGGASYLTALANSVPSSANIGHYVHIVKEKSTLRTLINNATKIISLCYESEGNIDEVVDNAERFIFEVRERKSQGSYLHIKEIVSDSIETIDSLYRKKAHVTGIPTG